MSGPNNGKILPILHLNGYKISGPTIYARKSERELNEMIRGFGFTPILINSDDAEEFQKALNEEAESPFYIFKNEKGFGGPNRYHDSHQIPLKNVKKDKKELEALEDWLKSYYFNELFNVAEGFKL